MKITFQCQAWNFIQYCIVLPKQQFDTAVVYNFWRHVFARRVAQLGRAQKLITVFSIKQGKGIINLLAKMAYHIVENNSSTWATTSVKVGIFELYFFFGNLVCEQIFILNATEMRRYNHFIWQNMKPSLAQLSTVKCFVSTGLRTYFLYILLWERHFDLLRFLSLSFVIMLCYMQVIMENSN